MDNHPNDNLHTCADTQWTSKEDYYSNTTSCPEKQRKKVIYNRSRIVHVDEMIRAILPKLDTVQQASVQHYYDAWKRKQLKTHHLLVHLRNIVSLDLLHSEVERIRQDKWRKSRRQSTRRNNRLFTVATNNNNNNITTPENEETKTNNNSGPCNLPTEEHAAVSGKFCENILQACLFNSTCQSNVLGPKKNIFYFFKDWKNMAKDNGNP